MDEAGLAEVAGADAFLVGGVIRDELLGRPIVDVDIACADPEAAARAWAERTGGALVRLSERHGAWRVAFRGGTTVDFAPLRGTIEEDLATRDFTANAIARPLERPGHVDPLGGLADLEARILRAVSDEIFLDDPLRLLRAVRLEEELGFALVPETEALVRRDATLVGQPAGERIFGELERMGEHGIRRLDELGLLAPLGGSLARLDAAAPCATKGYALALALGDALFRLPISNDLRRFARSVDRNFRRRGQPPIPLFLSEFFLPTAPDSELNVWVDPPVQAAWISAILRTVRSSSRIAALGWIHLYDDPPSSDGTPVSHGGLLNADGTPKPGYAAFKDG